MASCNHTNAQGEFVVQWAAEGLYECVYGLRGWFSAIFGLISICCWVPAQFPQIYKNWKNSSAEGLALVFLLQWVFGDLLNFLGCLLTPQLPTQLYQASYFICVDLMLFSQFTYYTVLRKRCLKGKGYVTLQPADPNQSVSENDDLKRTRHPTNQTMYAVLFLMGLFGVIPLIAGFQLPTPEEKLENAGRVLSAIVQLKGSTVQIIGTVIAWSSAAFYLGSRVPQIYKNYKRKSTDGLAIMMFICAVMGNSTYTVSILLVATKETIISSLPFIMGSCGTICFDFTIFFQFYYFRNRKPIGETTPINGA